MRKMSIIGNLGADAELRNENGSKFVRMSIAHTEKRKRDDGTEYEVTEWVSATINGDGGNLLPHLKKGTKIYAYGDISLRLFHSEKERRMIPSLNLFVRSIELVGGVVDSIPRDLYDESGVAHHVDKYYNCADVQNCELFDRSGNRYVVNENGWISRVDDKPANNNETVSQGTNEGDSTEKKKKNDKK